MVDPPRGSLLILALGPWCRRLIGLAILGSLLLGGLPVRAQSEVVEPAAYTYLLAFAQASSVAPNETWILVANPGTLPATVRLTLYPDASEPSVSTYLLAPGTRQAILANFLAPNTTFASVVESDRPLVVERSAYHSEGGVSAAAMVPDRAWLFALSGPTMPSDGFAAFNPSQTSAQLLVTYVLGNGTRTSETVVLPPLARRLIDPGSSEVVEVRVDSDLPVVVERLRLGMDGSIDAVPGQQKTSRLWYFPAAVANADPPVLVLSNSSDQTAVVVVDRLAPWGPVDRVERILPPHSFDKLILSAEPGEYGLQVQSTIPIVAHLSCLMDDGTEIVHLGTPDLGWTWLFAEGTVSGPSAAELRVLNPNANAAQVRARLLDESGVASTLSFVAAPHAMTRFTLTDADLPRASGVEVTSDVPIAVERVQPIQRRGSSSFIATIGASPDAIHFQGRDVLDGRFLLLNMPAMLFREDTEDIRENIRYARWMNAGAIRVFTTDPITYKGWGGGRIGARIVEIAPDLRAAGVKLIVPLVSNYQPVPGESPSNFGFEEGFYQILLPFYQESWRGAYLSFSRELITTVRDAGALDVIAAWEIGNELHTPENPPLILHFMREMSAEIRQLDPKTPTLAGTMGINHLDPWQVNSPVARALYCELPFDAYTLHTYDWVDRFDGGDMPIDWDLDNITNAACPSGRRLPVLVEELGTSKALYGRYDAVYEEGRVSQELHQLRFVLGYPIVKGIGAWSAESPLLTDPTYFDGGRGLTSYGPNSNGTGSCYPNGVDAEYRCRLETILRDLPRLPP